MYKERDSLTLSQAFMSVEVLPWPPSYLVRLSCRNGAFKQARKWRDNGSDHVPNANPWDLYTSIRAQRDIGHTGGLEQTAQTDFVMYGATLWALSLATVSAK